MTSYLPLILSILLSSSLSAAPTARMWTSSDGRQLKATLISSTNNAVILKLNSGKRVTIPLNSLSEQDNEFVKKIEEIATTAKADAEDGIDMPNKWPDIVNGPQEFKLKESTQRKRDGGGMLYKTRHFEFSCTTPLDDASKDAVGRLYEATWIALKAMPLPFPRLKRNSGQEFIAKLAKNMDEYHFLGGPIGSAGVFMSRGNSDMTLVPYPMLNINEEGVLDTSKKISHGVLSHEITHQLTARGLGTDSWVVEGLADYVAAIPYDGTAFHFSGAFEHIQGAAARQKLDNINYTFEEFLTMKQEEFYDKKNGSILAPRNYLLGTICVAYFFHLDGEAGIKNFRDYIVASSKGKRNALRQLLGKRKIGELEEHFTQAWEKQGITIKFKNAADKKK